MKDSKEKEHRISNLKEMIDNVSDVNDNEKNSEELEEDIELINYLKENHSEYDKLEIDDEFIYRPNEDKGNAINLEETHINKDYLINTPKEIEIKNEDSFESDELYDDYGDVSESFDSLVNAKVGRTPILAVISSILGLILIIFGAYTFSNRSDRVVDNVVAGETNITAVIFFAIGLLLLIYGLYRVFGFKNPFENISKDLSSIEKGEKKETPKKIEEPKEKVIPKSNIPLDKESYKIGEYNIRDLKAKFKKPSSTKKPKPTPQEELDNIPPAREKPKERKGLTSDEIEEIEYNQVVLDGESIDDIFAEVEDIEDMPIISIDSENKKEK